jgi:signal transduction histidine kinase
MINNMKDPVTKSTVSTHYPELSVSTRRWIIVWNVLSYAMLLLASAVALVQAASWPLRAGALLGGAAWGVWYWFFVVQSYRWEKRISWQGFSFLAAILLTGGLCWINMIYLILLFSMYGVTFGVLRMAWSAPLALLISLLGAARIIGPQTWLDQRGLSILAAFGFSSVLAILLGLYISSIAQQSHERQRMIEQLQSTRDELAKAERQAGVLEERQRVAAALHDTLAQGNTGILMHLEAAEGALDSDPQAAQRHIDQARRMARDNLSDVRRFLWALRPELAERAPFAQALERVVKRWSAENGLPVSLVVEGAPRPLAQPIEVFLLRTAQEALANVLKHAHASQVNLTLTYMEDEALLDVQDDGEGFDPALALAPNAEGGGFGLLSLREQAQALGGALQIESAPGEGATLVLQLPISPGDTHGTSPTAPEETS